MKKEQVLVVILIVMVSLAGVYWFAGNDLGTRQAAESETPGKESVTETVTGRVTGMSEPGPGRAGINWNDYTPGMARARNQGKNIFLYFYADWCTYCVQLNQTTFQDENVRAYLEEHFISIAVDADQNQTLSQTWQVRGLPTMWFLTSEGDRISSLPGFVDGPQMQRILRYIHTESYLTMSFQDYVRQ